MKEAGLKFEVLLCAIAVFAPSAVAQRSRTVTSPVRDVVQAVLIAPGSKPFHIRAVISRGMEQAPYATVEMSWMGPDKYRRQIVSKDFVQTLIVNGTDTYEENSWPYFPVELQTLVTAMVDPRPIVAAVVDGDDVKTKANGAVDESGRMCFDAKRTKCLPGNGLREKVGASGHAVEFSDYRVFEGKRVARVLTNAPRLGEEPVQLTVVKLEALESPDPSISLFAHATPAGDQLRFVRLDEADLRAHVDGKDEIVWPQPLDGAERGEASFFISVERDGLVREVHQLYTANERTNDSAKSQLMKWKFKPVLVDGIPAQVEGILHFQLDTRGWGPKEPLTDAEARKLATRLEEPNLGDVKVPAGSTYRIWFSVDSEGRVIEVMAGDGANGLFVPCLQAIQHSVFQPLMVQGEPRPYRAQIVFRIP